MTNPDKEINLEADGAVNDLCERYADAVTTIHRLYLSAKRYAMDTQSPNIHGFAGFMKSHMEDLKHELKKHGVKL